MNAFGRYVDLEAGKTGTNSSSPISIQYFYFKKRPTVS